MAHRDAAPLVSVVITSYNYERFIGRTLKSVLDQSLQDFEIVVVDDASSDASVDAVRAIGDPRIRLHVNDRNEGVAAAFNRGVGLARGEFINYVASDDWIDASKLERQVGYFRQHPDTDILGAYLEFHDVDGNRHRAADHLEAFFNQPHDLNSLETWIGANKLCAPTVLLRRAVFDRIGFRDTTMKVGSDFEFWTRAQVRGCRYAMLLIRLAHHRVHGNSASQRDPLMSFLDVTYVMQKNILPAMEAGAALHLLPRALNWVATHGQFAVLEEEQRCRLLALLLDGPTFSDCAAYENRILREHDPELTALGRRCFAALCVGENAPAQPLRLPDLLRESETDRANKAEHVRALTADVTGRDEQIRRLTEKLRDAEARQTVRHAIRKWFR